MQPRERGERLKKLQHVASTADIKVSTTRSSSSGLSAVDKAKTMFVSMVNPKFMNWSRAFTLAMAVSGGFDGLLVAHTCFNRVDLPLVEDADDMLARIESSLEQGRGFHLE